MPNLELYGTAACPFTRDMRESLLWRRQTFVEYDVDEDADALRRLTSLTGQRAVPVLVADGRVLRLAGRAGVVTWDRRGSGGHCDEPREAVQVHVRGVVQGVGFRPSVFRLARNHALNGWVLNAENGVEIRLEGSRPRSTLSYAI